MPDLTFTCPLYPGKNQLLRYAYARTAHKRKLRYFEKVAADLMLARLRAKPMCPLERAHVRIVLHFKTNRRRDVQNYAAAEWLLDAMVHFSILEDDSEKNIGTPLVEFGEIDPENPRCEVTVTCLD